jgi:hypothetical protein
MSKTTITFRGLCAFIEHANHYDACLLAGAHAGHHGGHPAHLASLSVDIEDINTDPGQTTWLPGAVIYEKTGGPSAQIGVWKLDPGVVTLQPNVAGPGRVPAFTDRSSEIDLSVHHTPQEARAKSRADLVAAGASIVQLVDGAIAGRERGNPLKLMRGTTRVVEKDFVRAYEWSLEAANLKVKIVSSAGTIALKENARVSVTNVAPVMGSLGLAHFAHYYETFARAPESGALLHLEFTTLDEPVYDCVPPVPGPTP